MRISTRGQYALRAMCRLVVLQQAGNGEPISIRDIAEKEGISSQYLEQLFRGLRGAGLVESMRGAKGGYTLAKPSEGISVADILRAVEGPIAPVECVESDCVDECCERKDYCMTREAWVRLRDSMVETLDSINLADLCKPAESSAKPDGLSAKPDAGPDAGPGARPSESGGKNEWKLAQESDS